LLRRKRSRRRRIWFHDRLHSETEEVVGGCFHRSGKETQVAGCNTLESSATEGAKIAIGKARRE
jgi:hypothetical protein